MERRNFLKNAALSTGSIIASPLLSAYGEPSAFEVTKHDKKPLHELKKPLAIAMWDFSWILRHHRYGEFENWDRVLNELAERGYNAIRMDAMPHLVAPTPDGRFQEEYYFKKDSWQPALWGNNYSMR